MLFISESKSLKGQTQVEVLREKLYSVLEEYCKASYPDQPGRFAKLLLRLPALRSIGLKCVEHLFFYKLMSEQPLSKRGEAIGEFPNMIYTRSPILSTLRLYQIGSQKLKRWKNFEHFNMIEIEMVLEKRLKRWTKIAGDKISPRVYL